MRHNAQLLAVRHHGLHHRYEQQRHAEWRQLQRVYGQMISALLASYLSTQTWAWNKAPEADVVSYRLCAGATGMAWCTSNCVTIPASACDATECQGEIAEPAWSIAFFIVTAIDAAGNESQTEHGPIGVCP